MFLARALLSQWNAQAEIEQAILGKQDRRQSKTGCEMYPTIAQTGLEGSHHLGMSVEKHGSRGYANPKIP